MYRLIAKTNRSNLKKFKVVVYLLSLRLKKFKKVYSYRLIYNLGIILNLKCLETFAS